MDWYVYMLKCRDGSFYTGISTDVEARVKTHNCDKARASRYVWSRRPVILVYSERVMDKSTALKREATIKKLTRDNKECLIKS